MNQLIKETPKLQADVDYLRVNQISADAGIKEAEALYGRWPALPTGEKRKVAEALCEKILKNSVNPNSSCRRRREEAQTHRTEGDRSLLSRLLRFEGTKHERWQIVESLPEGGEMGAFPPIRSC